jgi:hypothetical protein
VWPRPLGKTWRARKPILPPDDPHGAGHRDVKTTFKNASGLPNPAQVTTARDFATLSLRIQRDFPSITPISVSPPSTTRADHSHP